MRTIILALIVSLSVGCASTIYPTTIAQVADDGTKVVQTAHQISLSAQSLSASIPTVLTVPQAAVIVQGAYQIEVDGQKLAALLTTYSQIKGTAQAPITAASIDALIGDPCRHGKCHHLARGKYLESHRPDQKRSTAGGSVTHGHTTSHHRGH